MPEAEARVRLLGARLSGSARGGSDGTSSDTGLSAMAGFCVTAIVITLL